MKNEPCDSASADAWTEDVIELKPGFCLVIQSVQTEYPTPKGEDVYRWWQMALPASLQQAETTVRWVTPDESQSLNAEYRGKPNPTNVLSFPLELPDYIDEPGLGDLVICPEKVVQESAEQQKPLEAHYAHLIIHGTLHLLGYDHIDEADALEMESLERRLMAQLGFADPYSADED